MCRYSAGEVIVISYQHIAGCQSLYSYILIHHSLNGFGVPYGSNLVCRAQVDTE